MDSLTVFVKMLDVFVLLVKGIGVAALFGTAAFMLRLLPGRVQRMARRIVFIVLFVVLLGESRLGIFAVSTLKLGIFAVGAAVAVCATAIVAAAKSARARRVGLGASSLDAACPVAKRDERDSTYFASYLRITPVLNN